MVDMGPAATVWPAPDAAPLACFAATIGLGFTSGGLNCGGSHVR